MKKMFPQTLSRYLAKKYAISFFFLLSILLGIVYLFETVELLRRATKFDNVSLSLVLQMAFFKLPEVGQIILPFAILFGAIFTFWSLVRRQELVVVRSAGLSVWQFLGPIVGVAFLIGIIHMTIINPIGAMLISKYQSLEVTYLGEKDNIVSVGEQGLWLRQAVNGGGAAILHSQQVRVPEWRLSGVTVFYFGKDGSFEKRVDSKSAVLEKGKWVFNDATTNKLGQMPLKKINEILPTDLTFHDIEDSFSTAQETPFWSLPSYIHTMEATGFDSRKLRLHFHGLLAQPILFAAMVFLAATVSLKSSRTQPTLFLMGGGVAIGFFIFFISSFLSALGASDQIPVILAAWFPPTIALIAGISVILTTEDG